MSFLKACGEGNLDEIKAMLATDTINRNKKLRQKSITGWNGLHRTVEKNHIECTKYLLTMEELDMVAETCEGETALYIGCNSPNTSIEIIRMLLEVNNDLVNYVNNETIDPLQCAIMSNRFDIVQLLIDYGSPVNRQDCDGEAALHIAARTRRVDCIHYLMYETDCDTNLLNKHGKTACFIYFISLLTKAIDFGTDPCISEEEIECFVQLVWFTYGLPMKEREIQEIFSMMDCCFEFYDAAIRNLYTEIVKLFFLSPNNPRHYFVRKILDARLPSDYCLITLMFEVNDQINDINFTNLRSNFLHELFTLYLANETFFNEYIAEVMSTGWRINELEQLSVFCAHLPMEISLQKLFTFTKSLIQYGIDFAKLLQQCHLYLTTSLQVNILLNAVVPLSKFTHVPIELIWTLHSERKYRHYHFNETNYFLTDYKALVGNQPNHPEVVTLKNLSRMSVRKYLFQKYAHYKALSIMYSLNIPKELRDFLCYNCFELKF